MVRPRALAVFMLMTNSNLFDCTIGKSAGFSPFRMRPVLPFCGLIRPPRFHSSRALRSQLGRGRKTRLGRHSDPRVIRFDQNAAEEKAPPLINSAPARCSTMVAKAAAISLPDAAPRNGQLAWKPAPRAGFWLTGGWSRQCRCEPSGLVTPRARLALKSFMVARGVRALAERPTDKTKSLRYQCSGHKKHDTSRATNGRQITPNYTGTPPPSRTHPR
jgi:hypothetical protein